MLASTLLTLLPLVMFVNNYDSSEVKYLSSQVKAGGLTKDKTN
jgi:uncharacterized integral membrane protein